MNTRRLSLILVPTFVGVVVIGAFIAYKGAVLDSLRHAKCRADPTNPQCTGPLRMFWIGYSMTFGSALAIAGLVLVYLQRARPQGGFVSGLDRAFLWLALIALIGIIVEAGRVAVLAIGEVAGTGDHRALPHPHIWLIGAAATLLAAVSAWRRLRRWA